MNSGKKPLMTSLNMVLGGHLQRMLMYRILKLLVEPSLFQLEDSLFFELNWEQKVLNGMSFGLALLGIGYVFFFMVGDREDFIPFNPFLYIDIPSTLLSGASYLFLMLGIYYKLGDWIQFSILRKDVDQYNRGKSWMLGYETKENDPFENEYFRQVFFEPILIGLVGISLILTELSMGLGVFFTTGAIFYGIDEYIYHNAKDIKFGKNRESIRKGKKNIKKHDEMDSKNPEDDMYDFS